MMNARLTSSLTGAARLRPAPCLPRWTLLSTSPARAFSTTQQRDATWGFIGLGQMGTLTKNSPTGLTFSHIEVNDGIDFE